MKLFKSFIIIGVMSLLFCAAANAENFIFRYRDGVVMPMSLDIEQDHLTGAFYLSDDEEELKRLLAAGIIEYYGPDAEVYLMDTANDSDYARQRNYEFRVTNAVGVVNNGEYDGRGVRVGIIDTGLAPDHPDIDYSKVVLKRNVVVDEDPDDVTDYWGHGTNVAGIIAAKTNNGIGVSSLAPGVELVIVKAFAGRPTGGGSATTTVSNLLLAVDYAVKQGCDVINMSSGFKKDSRNEAVAKAMEEVINDAYKDGVIVVAAAGNYTGTEKNDKNIDSPMLYPAAFNNTISVSSVDREGAVSGFSYHNSKVDVAACGDGVSILTTNGGSSTGSGTSYSSPYIAATAALIKQIDPECDTDKFRALLAATAQDAGEPGRDNFYGVGIVSVGRMMDRLLGRKLTVSELSYDPETFSASAVIKNSGFDTYRIKDIWKISSGSESSFKTETVNIAPRSEAIVNRTSMKNISHMAWVADSLEPLCPVSEVKPPEI